MRRIGLWMMGLVFSAGVAAQPVPPQVGLVGVQLDILAVEPQQRVPALAALERERHQAFLDALDRHLQGVAQRGGARERYAAAMLLAPATASKLQLPRQWLQQALDTRPRDVLVARAELDDCSDLAVRCDRTAALAWLQQQRADDMGAYVMMADASGRQDAAVAEAYWQQALAQGHYRSRHAQLVGCSTTPCRVCRCLRPIRVWRRPSPAREPPPVSTGPRTITG